MNHDVQAGGFAAVAGAQAQTTGTVVARVGFPAAADLCALKNPAGDAALEAWIRHAVRTAIDYFHVVHERFAFNAGMPARLMGLGHAFEIHPFALRSEVAFDRPPIAGQPIGQRLADRLDLHPARPLIG